MKNIKTFLIIMTVFLTFSCYQKNSIKGSGNIINEDRELANFNSIKVLGSIDLVINSSDDWLTGDFFSTRIFMIRYSTFFESKFTTIG